MTKITAGKKEKNKGKNKNSEILLIFQAVL